MQLLALHGTGEAFTVIYGADGLWKMAWWTRIDLLYTLLPRLIRGLGMDDVTVRRIKDLVT